MKKLMLLTGLLCLLLNVHAASISASERAKSHFKEYYSEVQNESWYNATDNSMYCIFQRDNKTDRVFYDSRGYWQYTLVSYLPSSLKKNIKDLVDRHFEGYHISYVNEIQSAYDEPIYMINIENAGNIKVIQVSGDNFEVKQSLIKE